MGTLETISHCVGNWNNSLGMQLQVIWIPASADVLFFVFFFPSLFPLAFSPLVRLLLPRQLRSAGAVVIQELLPRVSSIGTLDLSDNGTAAAPVVLRLRMLQLQRR